MRELTQNQADKLRKVRKALYAISSLMNEVSIELCDGCECSATGGDLECCVCAVYWRVKAAQDGFDDSEDWVDLYLINYGPLPKSLLTHDSENKNERNEKEPVVDSAVNQLPVSGSQSGEASGGVESTPVIRDESGQAPPNGD